MLFYLPTHEQSNSKDTHTQVLQHGPALEEAGWPAIAMDTSSCSSHYVIMLDPHTPAATWNVGGCRRFTRQGSLDRRNLLVENEDQRILASTRKASTRRCPEPRTPVPPTPLFAPELQAPCHARFTGVYAGAGPSHL